MLYRIFYFFDLHDSAKIHNFIKNKNSCLKDSRTKKWYTKKLVGGGGVGWQFRTEKFIWGGGGGGVLSQLSETNNIRLKWRLGGGSVYKNFDFDF